MKEFCLPKLKGTVGARSEEDKDTLIRELVEALRKMSMPPEDNAILIINYAQKVHGLANQALESAKKMGYV